MGAGASISSQEDASPRSRLTHAVIKSSVVNRRAVGIRFQALDISQQGKLSEPQLVELVQWMSESTLGPIDDVAMKNLLNMVLGSVDKHAGVDLETLCSLYEESIGAEALRQLCELKFSETVPEANSRIPQEQVLELLNAVIVNFNAMGYKDKEVDKIKQSVAATVLADGNEEVARSEFQEIFESLFIALRWIRNAEEKFQELDHLSGGELDEPGLARLAEWTVRSCSRLNKTLPASESMAMKRHMMDAFALDKDSILNTVEVMLLNEVLKQRTREHLTQTRPQEKSVKAVQAIRRVSHFCYTEMTDAELIRIGIAPLAREKFQQLDRLNTGMITREQVVELVEWILSRVTWSEFQLSDQELVIVRDDILEAFSGDLEQPLDFEEFCLLYDEIFVRIDVSRVWRLSITELGAGTELPASRIGALVARVLSIFLSVGYAEEDCKLIRERLADFYGPQKDTIIDAEELAALFENIYSKMRLLKSARNKFVELDIDVDGIIEEQELISLTDWVLGTYKHHGAMVTEAEVSAMRKTLLNKFGQLGTGKIGLKDMVALFEEVTEKRRWIRRLSTLY